MRYNSTLKSLLKKNSPKKKKRKKPRGKPQKTFQLPHPISCVITEARSRPRFIPHPEHERERVGVVIKHRRRPCLLYLERDDTAGSRG